MKTTCLVLGHPWKNFHEHWLLGNYFYFGGLLPPPICVDPLVWWKTHEGQFPNVDFFAKQVIRFPCSKLRLKNVQANYCFDSFEVLLLTSLNFGLD
jgi:hypothetical protein